MREELTEELQRSCIDIPAVKTNDQDGIDDYDAGKKIVGQKRQILVDTMGLILAGVVYFARIQDRDGSERGFDSILRHHPQGLEPTWADGGSAGKLIAFIKTACGIVLEITKKIDKLNVFNLL